MHQALGYRVPKVTTALGGQRIDRLSMLNMDEMQQIAERRGRPIAPYSTL